MGFRPTFNSYFKDEWNYQCHEGVGLKLSGYPTDITAFFDLLHQQSCNPIATRRILNELETNGIKYTTLMAHLNFDYIGDKLSEIGVKMDIVPPAPLAKIQNMEIDRAARTLHENPDANLTNFALKEEEVIIAKKRSVEFKKSIEWCHHHFGPYDPNEDIAKEHLQISKKSYDYKAKI